MVRVVFFLLLETIAFGFAAERCKVDSDCREPYHSCYKESSCVPECRTERPCPRGTHCVEDRFCVKNTQYLAFGYRDSANNSVLLPTLDGWITMYCVYAGSSQAASLVDCPGLTPPGSPHELINRREQIWQIKTRDFMSVNRGCRCNPCPTATSASECKQVRMWSNYAKPEYVLCGETNGTLCKGNDICVTDYVTLKPNCKSLQWEPDKPDRPDEADKPDRVVCARDNLEEYIFTCSRAHWNATKACDITFSTGIFNESLMPFSVSSRVCSSYLQLWYTPPGTKFPVPVRMYEYINWDMATELVITPHWRTIDEQKRMKIQMFSVNGEQLFVNEATVTQGRPISISAPVPRNVHLASLTFTTTDDKNTSTRTRTHFNVRIYNSTMHMIPKITIIHVLLNTYWVTCAPPRHEMFTTEVQCPGMNYFQNTTCTTTYEVEVGKASCNCSVRLRDFVTLPLRREFIASIIVNCDHLLPKPILPKSITTTTTPTTTTSTTTTTTTHMTTTTLTVPVPTPITHTGSGRLGSPYFSVLSGVLLLRVVSVWVIPLSR